MTALANDLAEFRTQRRVSLTGLSSSPGTNIILEALRREGEQRRYSGLRQADGAERDLVRTNRCSYETACVFHSRPQRGHLALETGCATHDASTLSK